MSTFVTFRVCYIFTLLLQFISFLTTYAGLTFFLKHINPFAPLILAIVVQGTFYILINSRSTRKRDGNWKRWLLLIIALFVSTSTSFVGVSNTIRNPVEDMRDTYKIYFNAHNSYLNNQSNQANIFTEDDIIKALNACTMIRSMANAKIVAIEAAMPNSDAMTNTTTSLYISGYTDDGEPIYRPSTTTSINVDLEILQSSLNSAREEINTTLNQLKYDDPSQLDANAIHIACKSTERKDEEEITYRSFISCLTEYAGLEKLLYRVSTKIEDIDSSMIFEATIDPNYFSEENLKAYHEAAKLGESAKLEEYEIITKDLTSTADTTSSLSFLPTITQTMSDLEQILIPSEISEAETIRNILNQEMHEKYNLLPPEDQKDLEDSFLAAQLPSSQLYPFHYLFNLSGQNQDWGSSLQALLLAALIDFFSLILSFSLIKRRDSVLYARNHKENIRNREEILEDCYTYLCMQKLTTAEPKRNLCTAADIRSFVSHTIENIMLEFVKKVRVCYIPDSLDSFGYITSNDLKNLNWEQLNLFQTLRLINLIRPVTREELITLLNAEFINPNKPGQSSLPQKFTDNIPDDLLYLIDNRLHMWYNENFSELLQSNLLFDDLKSIVATSISQQTLSKGGKTT